MNLRVSLAQNNTTIGDFEGNYRLIEDSISRARSLCSDVVAFHEMALCGYPVEDLALKHTFLADNTKYIRKIAETVSGLVAIIGFIDDTGEGAANAAAIIAEGEIVAIYRKIVLPNYGVFDEKRYFRQGSTCCAFTVRGASIGVTICEDIWPKQSPLEVYRKVGTNVLININSSPYEIKKQDLRQALVQRISKRNKAFIVYVNQVGGQDELVFDGGSMVADPQGNIIAELPQFEEATDAVDLDISLSAKSRQRVTDTDTDCDTSRYEHFTISLPLLYSSDTTIPSETKEAPMVAKRLGNVESIYKALVLGVRDYTYKTGFRQVVIALSGGIDSSLVACIATDALGSSNVLCLAMPSRYSSQGSLEDARTLTENLCAELWEIPIEPAHTAFEKMLSIHFAGMDEDVTEENIQARIRGLIVMAISNKFSRLVLTTGNKTEMATGYATLYGDMAGGFAPIKDVPKLMVYKLSRYRNEITSPDLIPRSVLEKPPSAELRLNQLDRDTLPPYEILDRILSDYIEEGKTAAEIISAGSVAQPPVDSETIFRILSRVDNSEYKRRQTPPGIKITSLAFGRDRRLPLASVYRAANSL